jgi:hypothetical protein
MTLFTSQSAKLAKGAGRGIEGLILYLAPATLDGVNNCPWSTAGCRATCLGETSGRMVMSNAKKAREWRTRMLRNDAVNFWTTLRKEISALVRKAERKGAIACVRLDGTSDLGLAKMLQREYPTVVFYDYTKSFQRMLEWLDTRDSGNVASNRHITFSYSGENAAECAVVLGRGGNVAVAFSTRKGEALPSTWLGFDVIDGDEHDWRFLDPRSSKGVVVGLRAKGAAKRDVSGFVVRVRRMS